ncbi:MAG: SMC-Scp complex subunit ScpB [Bacillota bacterium]
MNDDVRALIEAYIFAAENPVELDQIAKVAGLTRLEAAEVVSAIQKEYQGGHHGVELVHLAGGYSFRTKKEYGKRLAEAPGVGRRSRPLSRAAMETLAVIAYRGPVTKAEIEAIRGVNSEGAIETLLERGLIKEAGRKPVPGRPVTYAVTNLFLQLAGIDSVRDLPSIEDSSTPQLQG